MQHQTAASPAHSVKSADRALAIVDLVAAKGYVSFTEIVTALALPRSSAHGLLNTLHSAGWLEHDTSTRQYSLGLRAWHVGQMYTGHNQIANAARPVLDDLASDLGETVQLLRLDGAESAYFAISQHSSEGMRFGSSVGMKLPAHATAPGTALLSSLDPTEVKRRLVAAPAPLLVNKVAVEVPVLLARIAEVKARGYALDDEAYLAGSRSVAVPLTSATGGITTAISITMSATRTSDLWPTDVLRALVAAAHEVRVQLGAREPEIVVPALG
ncbi:IclR family transcriptional regulator [Salinibacterium sp. NSLL150]|uniref:IclR family transcriptional regulator n=1 Tax=unclassified Salinibacterium TaxID=2632331 RepID=UPI0018CD2898|nr:MULTISPECIES: IclR family transcriptional regulator [unclassified Salinibacterium]MBH0098597.1 IclR family transcriptional regulator [Salinibacterium sp. NSLL35]MBH0101352.1 IclR family transcriptional regulator [Salinibacterium sp. NSLL150]MBH0104111.1 IclR family transcriptional regulator [Salinibacterium sp. NSLL16]MBH0106872.1 IclR family transcriptional regulator [Salinibacterium sp. NSLL17]